MTMERRPTILIAYCMVVVMSPNPKIWVKQHIVLSISATLSNYIIISHHYIERWKSFLSFNAITLYSSKKYFHLNILHMFNILALSCDHKELYMKSLLSPCP